MRSTSVVEVEAGGLDVEVALEGGAWPAVCAAVSTTEVAVVAVGSPVLETAASVDPTVGSPLHAPAARPTSTSVAAAHLAAKCP